MTLGLFDPPNTTGRRAKSGNPSTSSATPCPSRRSGEFEGISGLTDVNYLLSIGGASEKHPAQSLRKIVH